MSDGDILGRPTRDIVIQSALIHPDWTVETHIAYLAEEGYAVTPFVLEKLRKDVIQWMADAEAIDLNQRNRANIEREMNDHAGVGRLLPDLDQSDVDADAARMAEQADTRLRLGTQRYRVTIDLELDMDTLRRWLGIESREHTYEVAEADLILLGREALARVALGRHGRTLDSSVTALYGDCGLCHAELTRRPSVKVGGEDVHDACASRYLHARLGR